MALWNIDTAHAQANFSARHMMITTVRGSFNKITGTINFDPANPAAASVEAVIDTTSMSSTGNDQRDGHLKSPDFFDVAKYPSAAFTATEFTPKASDNSSHEIAGELELHGVKKAIRFPAKLTIDSTTASGQAEFTINRKDFGIVYPGKPDDLIKDDVLLKLNLVFKP